MEEKKGNGKTILIATLVIIIIGLIGFIVYDKCFNKEAAPVKPQEEKEEKKEEKTEEIANDEITKIMEKIKKYNLGTLYHFGNQKFDTVSNEQLEVMVRHFGYPEVITKEKVDGYIKDVYNITPSSYNDIICLNDKIAMYKYNATNQTYIMNSEHPGHGGLEGDFTDYYVVSSKKEDNKYTMDILFLYGDPVVNGYSVNDKGLEILKIDPSNSMTEEQLTKAAIEYIKSHLDEYKDASKYQYVFEKDGNDYYLKEFNIVK